MRWEQSNSKMSGRKKSAAPATNVVAKSNPGAPSLRHATRSQWHTEYQRGDTNAELPTPNNLAHSCCGTADRSGPEYCSLLVVTRQSRARI
jgi:hypothetical protein